MTYDEALKLASGGDVQAMLALGDYHFNEDEGIDAFEWYSKAAEKGSMRGVALAALNGHISGYILIFVLRELDQAMDMLEKTLRYSLTAIKSNDINPDTRKTIKSHLGEVVYQLAFCYYMRDKTKHGASLLENHFEDLDDKGKVLLGICYAELAGDENDSRKCASLFNRAKPLLEMIEYTNMEVDSLTYAAFLFLSLINRMGGDLLISGMTNDVSKAREYMVKAVQRSGKYADEAQKQLDKYKKNLFGGYTYRE